MERQWGTVREDYSENGDAWNYFTQDQARSRATCTYGSMRGAPSNGRPYRNREIGVVSRGWYPFML
jgi:hypothetical protein